MDHQPPHRIANRADRTAADALLVALKAQGVDYLFANAGTDFPSIIEAIARAQAEDAAIPEALPIAHETVAVGMAHGYQLVTGRPQAVMVHVNVGLANSVMGVINAASGKASMLLLSGRTPATEQGRTGSRSSPIHWGQDMADQAALVREAVKWAHELHYPEQVGPMVTRALGIARSEPQGPVYLSLPREVLAEPLPVETEIDLPTPVRYGPPPAAGVARAAALIAAAKRPVLITHGLDDAADCAALDAFARAAQMPVVEYYLARFALPASHPLNAGRDPGPWLGDADLVIMLDTLVPFVPGQHKLASGAQTIAIGPDPLFQNTPTRGFAADLALGGGVRETLEAIQKALPGGIAARPHVAERQEKIAAAVAARVESGKSEPMGQAYVSHCISEALPAGAVLFNELACDAAMLRFEQPGSYFSTPLSGGLGFGLTAALGAQLADRSRQVVACVGDGSYIFANPVACHQVARALGLPLLTIVMNNGVWNAVRKSTLHMYPEGASAAADQMPLTSLMPGPDHCLIAKAFDAHAERVTHWADLPAALERALAATASGRQALLEIVVAQ